MDEMFQEDNWYYRLKNLDEFLAETITDAAFDHMEGAKDLAPKGSLKRLIQDTGRLLAEAFSYIKYKVGADPAAHILNQFIRGRNREPIMSKEGTWGM